MSLVGLGMVVASVWAAERIGDAYMDRLVEVYKLAWKSDEKAHLLDDEADGHEYARASDEPPPEDRAPQRDASDLGHKHERRVAAVCYRQGKAGVEFLLVTTRGDVKRWTFPKGRVDAGDSGPAAAAAREAKEEAGATGDIEHESFITYNFPSGKKAGKSVAVEAYLLRFGASGKRAKGDRYRRRGWFDPDKAKTKLGAEEAAASSESTRESLTRQSSESRRDS